MLLLRFCLNFLSLMLLFFDCWRFFSCFTCFFRCRISCLICSCRWFLFLFMFSRFFCRSRSLLNFFWSWLLFVAMLFYFFFFWSLGYIKDYYLPVTFPVVGNFVALFTELIFFSIISLHKYRLRHLISFHEFLMAYLRLMLLLV